MICDDADGDDDDDDEHIKVCCLLKKMLWTEKFRYIWSFYHITES